MLFIVSLFSNFPQTEFSYILLILSCDHHQLVIIKHTYILNHTHVCMCLYTHPTAVCMYSQAHTCWGDDCGLRGVCLDYDAALTPEADRTSSLTTAQLRGTGGHPWSQGAPPPAAYLWVSLWLAGLSPLLSGMDWAQLVCELRGSHTSV